MYSVRLFKKDKPKSVTFENNEGRPKLNFDIKRVHFFKQQGKSNREIAKIIGCSEGTVRNRLRDK